MQEVLSTRTASQLKNSCKAEKRRVRLDMNFASCSKDEKKLSKKNSLNLEGSSNCPAGGKRCLCQRNK